MKALELRTHEVFKAKLGEKEAEIIIEFIETKSKEQIDDKKDIFMTKEDTNWFLKK
jgi:hypothetical protein